MPFVSIFYSVFMVLGIMPLSNLASLTPCAQAAQVAMAAPAARTLRVCSDAGFLPFEMKNSANEWDGFDIDMMRAFAKSQNFTLEMIQISFDGIIPALLSKKCDMIATGMTVTAARKRVVAFSTPTFINTLSIAVRKSDDALYQIEGDLDKKNVKIAVKNGYTSDIYALKSLPNAEILRFDQDADLYLSVIQGRTQAFISDTTYVSLIAKNYPNKLKIIPTKAPKDTFAVATRLQDAVLLNAFNAFLARWKNTGEYKKTYQKYFGSPVS